MTERGISFLPCQCVRCVPVRARCVSACHAPHAPGTHPYIFDAHLDVHRLDFCVITMVLMLTQPPCYKNMSITIIISPILMLYLYIFDIITTYNLYKTSVPLTKHLSRLP